MTKEIKDKIKSWANDPVNKDEVYKKLEEIVIKYFKEDDIPIAILIEEEMLKMYQECIC